MQHQARLFGNKRNRKRGHIAMGGTKSWSECIRIGVQTDSQCSTRSQEVRDLLLYKRRSLDSHSAELIWGYFCRSLHFLPFVQTRAHC